MVHILKCISPYFEAVESNTKRFELRYADRNYKAGDLLVLRHYNPINDSYFDGVVIVRVLYLFEGGKFGLPRGTVIMSIEHI